MQNVDELCIKYVLNELDPSERLLVEKAMRDDENVLIEIESLRCTLRKLDQLPEVSPPEAISATILEKARQHAEAQKRVWPVRLAWGGLAAAAIVLLVFGAQFINYPESDLHQAGFATEITPMENAETISDQPVLQASNLNQMQVAPLAKTDPWIDKQNILRINISYGPNGEVILGTDAASTANAGMLRPVEQQQMNTSYPVMRDIQLTRTQR